MNVVQPTLWKKHILVHLPAIGLFCLIIGGLSAQEPAKKDEPKKETARFTPGRVEKRTYEFKEAKKEIEYALFVPTKYDKNKKTPLVVALHGLGGNPMQFIRSRGMTEQAETLASKETSGDDLNG